MRHPNAAEMRLIGRPEDIDKMVERVKYFFTVLEIAPYTRPSRKHPGMVIQYLTVVNPGDAHQGVKDG